MRSTSPVSRPAWVDAMNALTGAGGANRKSPVEIIADAASVVTHSPYAEVAGISHGKLGRWTDGVAELRADRTEFASYWGTHNDRVLSNRDLALRNGDEPDPLWVVLGDSTAQGLGAPAPRDGYVGQTLYQLRRTHTLPTDQAPGWPRCRAVIAAATRTPQPVRHQRSPTTP